VGNPIRRSRRRFRRNRSGRRSLSSRSREASHRRRAARDRAPGRDGSCGVPHKSTRRESSNSRSSAASRTGAVSEICTPTIFALIFLLHCHSAAGVTSDSGVRPESLARTEFNPGVQTRRSEILDRRILKFALRPGDEYRDDLVAADRDVGRLRALPHIGPRPHQSSAEARATHRSWVMLAIAPRRSPRHIWPSLQVRDEPRGSTPMRHR
jgi:hypothetical protein